MSDASMTAVRTLLLEDSPTDAELAVFELERAGLPIVSQQVATREAFTAAVVHFQPDVVLADYSLPNFSGREALQWTLEYYPRIPVIIVSGALGDERAIELIKAGACDYVLKTNLVRLGPAVIRALDEVRQAQAREEAEHALAAAAVEREKLLISLEQRVQERTAQLRAMAFELTKAEERERQAIARDLHDGLGQTLAIAKIKLSNLSTSVLDKEAASTIAVVEKLIDQSNRSVRSLAEQLTPPVLYDLGLLPALEWLVEQMERDFDLRCDITANIELEPLDQSVRAILFRAVRELLLNIVKHANVGLTPVRIDISTGDEQLQIVVTDTGKGFDPDNVKRTLVGGFGLLNVRERLAYIGGTIHIDSKCGEGTRVLMTAPMTQTD
jgi:signal transduction histidine kinase